MKNIITIILLAIPDSSFCQSKLTTKDIINKELVYKLEAGNILIRISSDTTIYWRNDSKPSEANEQSQTAHIDDHTIMTAWYESDKTFVNLLSDFDKLKFTGMVCMPGGKFYPIRGIIEVKN